jgi:hypothetical protein
MREPGGSSDLGSRPTFSTSPVTISRQILRPAHFQTCTTAPVFTSGLTTFGISYVGTIAASIFAGFTLSSIASLSPSVLAFASIYAMYKIDRIEIEIDNVYNVETISSSLVGETRFCPLLTPDAIVDSGQSSLAWGGTVPTYMLRNTDWWDAKPGTIVHKLDTRAAGRYSFSPVWLKPAVDNANLDSSVPATYELVPTRGWIPTVDFTTTTPTVSNVSHYGVMVAFSGFTWSGGAPPPTFRVRYRYFMSFKDYQSAEATTGLAVAAAPPPPIRTKRCNHNLRILEYGDYVDMKTPE